MYIQLGGAIMKKIVVGGQIDKPEVKELVEKFGDNQYEIDIKSDLEAAMVVKNGQADYYVGACNTGGGGHHLQPGPAGACARPAAVYTVGWSYRHRYGPPSQSCRPYRCGR